MPTLLRLTTRQRYALCFAVGQGISTKDPAPIQAGVIDELAHRGLIRLRHGSKGRLLWRATELGTAIIASEGLTPIYLHKRGFPPYTRDPEQAMTAEPEPVLACA